MHRIQMLPNIHKTRVREEERSLLYTYESWISIFVRLWLVGLCFCEASFVLRWCSNLLHVSSSFFFVSRLISNKSEDFVLLGQSRLRAITLYPHILPCVATLAFSFLSGMSHVTLLSAAELEIRD